MSAAPECVRAFFEEVFRWFPYTPEAEEWLKRSVTFEVEDLNSTRGGGWWQPAEDKVFLYTAQYEAAIHELAHAWWHYRRLGVEDEFMAVVQRLLLIVRLGVGFRGPGGKPARLGHVLVRQIVADLAVACPALRW